MARVGGRNLWIAVPAGLLCAGVVAGLAYLAAPMMPTAVGWAGDTLRSATANPFASPIAAAAAPGSEAVDCRELYPSILWRELTWRGDVLLSQDHSAPATAATSVVEALAPTVRLSCGWRFDDAYIASTLSTVSADAAPVAEAGLVAQGFACATADGLLTCTRTEGEVREEHSIGGGLWLASIETGWHPEDYGAVLAEHVW